MVFECKITALQTGGGSAILILTSVPVLSVVLGIVVLGERERLLRKLLAAGLAAAGMAVLAG